MKSVQRPDKEINKYADIKLLLKQNADKVNTFLDEWLPSADCYPQTIYQAMRYSLFAGGKRLRPALTMLAAEAAGGKSDKVLPAACGLEMIHTYSLIHDDLPALDNDNYRRGKLTCHKQFNESTAILAGDALLTDAFKLIASNNSIEGITSDAVLQVLGEIAELAGTGGMISGQMADIESEGKTIASDTMQYIHKNKTGALIIASVRTGAILCNADRFQLEQLTVYGGYFGLAFQITDDILDVTGSLEQLGKETGSDVKNLKATYPALYGLDKSRKLADQAIEAAADCLAGFGERAQSLRQLVRYIGSRVN